MWNRRSFPFIFAALFIVAVISRSLPLFAIWAVILVGYVISLRIHPRVRHTACNGSGERRGFFFRYKFRRCSGCASGRQVSWGTGHLGTARLRGEYQDGRQAQRNTRFWQRW